MATQTEPERDFHPGWAVRPFGCHHKRFTRQLWDLWLADLNREPKESRVRGIQEMRALLAARDIQS